MADVLFCDVETTGCWHEHEIIQFAGCIQKADGSLVDWFDFNVKPYDYSIIVPSALEVNKITIDELKNFEEPEVVMEKFLKIISKYEGNYYNRLIIGGYNVVFDINKLLNFFARVHTPNHKLEGEYWIYYKEFYRYFQNRHIDVMALLPFIEKKIGNTFKSHKLEDIFSFFFPDEELDFHNAKTDIYCTIKLYKLFYKVFGL